ncbi:HDOD domain-containing protein [Thiorhodococcus fuscus]|uniref:HDOD domain-containing protein n=1 Tax=Thiorhodococcus fuscus TaxID=527200 RepID=A0ABW4Y3Y7_9GAMM
MSAAEIHARQAHRVPILERIDDLPSLPSTYLRAREAMDDPNGSLETLAQIIGTDPAMSARILRVANSALYGLLTRVDSVWRALSIIGVAETRNLILATAVISAFKDLPLGAVSMRSFWEHSVACGVAARTIARRMHLSSPERFYLAGLLHDIGRLCLFILEPVSMSTALQAHRERQGPLHDIETQLFATDHAAVGAALLRHWGIPDTFCVAAETHHLSQDSEPACTETALTHVADVIVNSLRIGTSGTRWVPQLSDRAWRMTELTTSDLPDIVETSISTARDVTSAFLEH